MGVLNQPATGARGAGEGAAHMTEQLGLEQALGNGTAVDGEELPLPCGVRSRGG